MPNVLFCLFRVVSLSLFLLPVTVLHGQQQTEHYHERNGLLSDFTYGGMFDRNNYLWICSNRGLSRFNGTGFSHFTVREGLPDNDVVEVKEDESGVIWACPFLREPAFLEPGKTLFANINTIIHPDTVKKDRAYAIFLLRGNTVGLVGRNVIRLVRNRRWIKSIQLRPGTFGWHSVLFENEKGDLVLFGQKKVVVLHASGGADTFSQVFPYIWKEWEGPLLWLHCRDNSLICIDTRKGTIGKMIHRIPAPDSIYRYGPWNDSVLVSTKEGKLVMADRDGRGFSLLKGPVLLSTTAESKDKRVKVMFTRDKGISVLLDADTALYRALPAAPASFLLRGAELEVLDAQNRWLLPERLRGIQLPGYRNRFTAELSEVSDGLTWTYGNAVELWKAGVFLRQIDTVINVKDVSCSNDSTRYLAAQTGAFMLNIARRTLRRLYDQRSNSVSEGPDGSLFIGTYHGLLQRLADGSMVDWNDKGFPDVRVTDLVFKDGMLWIATAGRGLWGIRHRRLYRVLNENSGLVSDAIESMTADNKGHIMLGYAKGVQRIGYEPDEERFGVKELLTLHTVKGEGIRYLCYLGGTVYGIGSRGLLTVPEQWREPVRNFRLQIDRVLIDGVPTELDSHYILAPGSHDFSVLFSVVNYDQFPVRYRYRINDEAWTYTSDPQISYHSLGPGYYNIELQVLNNYERPSSVRLLQLVVQRPFYLRPGFILTSAVVLFLLLVAAVRIWYRYQYRKAQKAMQQEMRLQELELAALKAQINPHFVFNCLNSIKALIYEQRLEDADRYMDHFARLFRSTLEGAAMPCHSLAKEVDFIRAYLSLEQVNADNRFAFDIRIGHTVRPESVLLPPMLLQPYVENAVKHGVTRLRGRTGKIVVCFEQKDGRLLCTIADNGPGIAGTEPKTVNGQGMKISERRAQLHHIHTDITDNTPSGTVVRLSLSLVPNTPTNDYSLHS